MAVDCTECRKTCFKTDIKSLVKSESFVFSILLVIVSVGMATTRIFNYDSKRPGIFHKLPYDITFQPNGVVGIFKYFLNKSNVKMGDIVEGLTTTKEGQKRNKIFQVLVGLVGILSIVGVIFYQLFLAINLFMGKINGTQPKLPGYWPLYGFGPIWLIIILVFLVYLISLIAYLLSTPEFFFATIITVSSMMLYFYMPQYPYMPMGLSGGGLIGILLLGGK